MYANKKRMNREMAVSPIVATLVLIVVAVIGAVAVGTIMGTFSTQVSKQASAGQAASASQNEIIIAGSTTCIPVEQNLAADFERANPGVQINVQGGGSSEGPQSVALGIADIGATSSSGSITTAVNANTNNPVYANMYFTQLGGRGVVFIQDASEVADPTNTIAANDLLYSYLDASANSGKTTGAAGDANITSGTTMEQREAGSGTMKTAFDWIGGAVKSADANGLANIATNNGNAQMLAAVQAGSKTTPIVGFVDAGYALPNGGTTAAPGIAIMQIATSTGLYTPSHANIKNALHDWYYSNAQNTVAVYEDNYPQGLVGGLYWLTSGSAPSTFNGNQVVQGTSTASTVVQGFITFAHTPSEEPAFTSAGVYSMYDFM